MPHLTRRRARLAAVALVVTIVAIPNVYLALRSIGIVLSGAEAVDWHHFVQASSRVSQGELYDFSADYGYRYSPVLAYAFAPLSLMGTLGWRLLHVVAAFALPTWPMRIVTLLSWPFWFDVEAGNIMVFVVLAAAWAIRGNAIGSGAFILLTLLAPRPLMLPVAAWILWKQPEWRVPFAAAFVVHVVVVAFSGWGPDWVTTLVISGNEMGSPLNVGPSRFIGTAWLAIGLPLAAWLLWKGRLGFASLAVSPYWLPYYLLMPILELDRRRPDR